MNYANPNLLKTIPFYSDFNESEILKLVDISEFHTYDKGQSLIKQGTINNKFTIILNGKAEAFVNGILMPIQVSTGILIGEVSFFTEKRAGATAITSEKTVVQIINYDSLKKLIEMDPNFGLKIYRRLTLEILNKYSSMMKELVNLAFNDQVKKAAHDLRSPLAALKTLASSFSTSLIEEKELLEQVVDRVDRIANTLLNTPATNDHSTIENISLLRMSECIKKLMYEKKIQHLAKPNITLEYKTSFSIEELTRLNIKVNQLELERIISNLIDNSIQALQSSGGVEINFYNSNNSAIFEIKDTGQGIPQDILHKLGTHKITFGKSNGNGIGVLNAKQQIESWNGTMKICSEINKGTQIIISLPIAAEPAQI